MIRTPPHWGADMMTRAYRSMTEVDDLDAWRSDLNSMTPAVRRIKFADLQWALARGWEDFGASRTDVIFVALMYPVLGLLIARLAFGYELLPLVFPLASGFALIGPLAAVGLNELSRRRELGLSAGWADAFHVFRSPSLNSMMLLGAALILMFVFWLVLADALYSVTMGPRPPVSVNTFLHDVVYTREGHIMAIVGTLVGFAFAVAALCLTIVSFPMLLDRHVSLETAVRTSLKVVRRNPATIALWGLIVAASLIIGSIPLLLGLIFVMPVLGHATWHLYRRVIPQ